MSLATNVVRRGGRYSARLVIPTDLRSAFGKKEVWQSLDTADPDEAKRRVGPVVESWRRKFDDLRRRREATLDDLQNAAWGHYESELQHDRLERAAFPEHAEIDAEREKLEASFAVKPPSSDLEALNRALDFIVKKEQPKASREFRQHRAAILRQHLRDGETALIRHAADAVIELEGLLVERGSRQYRELCQRMQRAEIESLKRADERDQGDWTGVSSDPVVQPLGRRQSKAAPPGESIMERFEQYARENAQQITKDALDQNRASVKLFAEIAGEGAGVSSITRKLAADWKGLLLQYPSRAAQIKEFSGSSMRDTIRLNEKLKKPVLSRKTVNRNLAGLGSFSNWLVANGHRDDSPVRGLFLKVDKISRTRIPFTSEQMNILFKAPLFTKCQSADAIHLPGKVQVRDHQYWIPLLMLFSGARPGELAQMLVADVKKMHDAWTMHITDTGDETKRVKTRGSVRIVPVHSRLVRMGFIQYVEKLRKKGEKRLFPQAERNSREQIASKFSRDFGRLLERLEIKSGKGLSLYSFRHGAVDAMRRAEFFDEAIAPLIGHSAPSMTAHYGILHQATLRQRVEMIEAIAYPGLEISHLYRATN